MVAEEENAYKRTYEKGGVENRLIQCLFFCKENAILPDSVRLGHLCLCGGFYYLARSLISSLTAARKLYVGLLVIRVKKDVFSRHCFLMVFVFCSMTF